MVPSSDSDDSIDRIKKIPRILLKNYMNETFNNLETKAEWDQLLQQCESFESEYIGNNLNDDQVSVQQLRKKSYTIQQKLSEESSFDDIDHPNDITFRVLGEDNGDEREDEIILQKSSIPNNPSSFCSCNRIKCLKQYCSCFAKGIKCTVSCQCLKCENNHSKPPKKQVMFIDETKDKGCKCAKNNCLKKYCQCQSNSKFCSKACFCLNCKNREVQNQHRALQDISSDLDILDQTILIPRIKKKIRKFKQYTSRKNQIAQMILS